MLCKPLVLSFGEDFKHGGNVAVGVIGGAGKCLRRKNTEHAETLRHEGCLGVGSLRSLTDKQKVLTTEPHNHSTT